MRTLRCLAEYSVLARESFTLAPAAAPLYPALVEGPVRVIFPRNPGELAMCGRLPFGKGEVFVDASWSGAVMCPAC